MGDERPQSIGRLTERELEILSLITNGLSNQQIAGQLFLTVDTVKWYNSQIYQKLGVRSRTQAVVQGRARGLLRQMVPATRLDLPIELPLQTTIFIGRERELHDIQSKFSDVRCRLLSLVGTGGIGKTRLAMEAGSRLVKQDASAFPHGVILISLQTLNSPDFIVSAIADALHFQIFSTDNPKQQLLAYLRDKSFLLIFDNFEHLLDGATLVSEILAAASGIKIMVTSREALNLQEEWLYPIEGMPYPHQREKLESYEAVQLFMYHAQRIRTNFSLAEEAEGVLRICTLAEGMPLALELAAAWVRALSCSEIANEIEAGLDILETSSRNVLPRHRNMRAVLRHSWMLLSDAQREVFKKLSVFRGSFTREAAQAITDTSLRILSALVDKSWLRWDAAHKRYNVHELLWQFGQECLQENPDVWQNANDRHCHYYVSFLEQRWQDLRGVREKEAYTEIENELQNVRACWNWAVEHEKQVEINAATGSLWRFYDIGSRYQEGQNAFAQAVDRLRPLSENADTRLLLGKVLARQGALSFALDRLSEAKTLLRESQHILSEFDAPGDLAFCLNRLSMTIADITNPQWKALVEESLALFRQIGDLSGIGEGLTALGTVYEYQFHDLDKAIELTQEGLAACSEAGDQWGMATAYSRLAGIIRNYANYQEALDYAQKGLILFRRLGVVWGIIITCRECGWAMCGLGMFAEARVQACDALAMSEKYGLVRYTLHTMLLFATLQIEAGEPERALQLCALVEETSRKMGSYPHTEALLSRLEHELPAEIYSENLRQGKSLIFEDMVKALLSELKI